MGGWSVTDSVWVVDVESRCVCGRVREGNVLGSVLAKTCVWVCGCEGRCVCGAWSWSCEGHGCGLEF